MLLQYFVEGSSCRWSFTHFVIWKKMFCCAYASWEALYFLW